MKFNINKNLLIFLFPIITLLLVLTSNKAQAESSRRLPTAYVQHTYGALAQGRAFQSLQTWEDLTDVNLASVTTTDQPSSGNTLGIES